MAEPVSPFREAFLASFDDRRADLFRRLGLWMAERNLRSDLRHLIARMDSVLEGGADPGSRPR